MRAVTSTCIASSTPAVNTSAITRKERSPDACSGQLTRPLQRNRTQLERWVRDAPAKALYRRRLAILWTARDGRHATEIAGLLTTSTRTVRRWIQQFNAGGPTALDEENFGGRRWAHHVAPHCYGGC